MECNRSDSRKAVSTETRVGAIRTIREKHRGTGSPRDKATRVMNSEDKCTQFCRFAADHPWG